VQPAALYAVIVPVVQSMGVLHVHPHHDGWGAGICWAISMSSASGKSAGQVFVPSSTTTGPFHPVGSGTQEPVQTMLPEVELALVLVPALVLGPPLAPEAALPVVPVPPAPPSRVSCPHLPKS
jgi:hypothetical protein